MKLNDAVTRIAGLLGEARGMLEKQRDTLQEAFDEKSEKWQEGDAGQAALEKISSIEELIGEIESAETSLEDLKGE